MTDKRAKGVPLSDEKLDSIGGGVGTDGQCDVLDEAFPRLGKCCIKSNSLSGTAYQQACPFCSIWTSRPEGSSLSIYSIIECSLLGYGRRIKDL